MVKLEVHKKKKTLYPDMIQTLETSEKLISKGFKVLAYCNDDPILAKKLVNFDCSLLDILEEFNIKSSFIAIEVNKEVVPKSKYSTKKILKGDNIEILQMIGGG